MGDGVTRNEIIELADECGAVLLEGWDVDMLIKFAQRVIKREHEAVLDTINEMKGYEQDRHPMFSDGYDYALENIETYIRAREQA